ncbi:hypothetical protein ACQB60_44750 [Actinomycetota bacterium Odt1-20B]
MTGPAPARRPLPTREQVVALRDFIHDRTYAAAAATLLRPGEPPHAPDSCLARVGEVSQALHQATDHLSSRLDTELAADQPGPVAKALRDALTSIAEVWRDDPEFSAIYESGAHP